MSCSEKVQESTVFERLILTTLFTFGSVCRDMTVQENQTPEQVCLRLDVRNAGVRFGTVPEFTSKILSILTFHHSHQRTLKIAMKRPIAKGAKSPSVQSRTPRQAIFVPSCYLYRSTQVGGSLSRFGKA
jgi:hypothetical protein